MLLGKAGRRYLFLYLFLYLYLCKRLGCQSLDHDFYVDGVGGVGSQAPVKGQPAVQHSGLRVLLLREGLA